MIRSALSVACVVLLISVSARAGEPVTVKITRPSAFIGKFAPLDVYINDSLVGTIRNNETKSFQFAGAKIGKNELRVQEDTVLGNFTWYQNMIDKTGEKKYFLVTKPGEELAITVGNNDENFKQNFYTVTNEVSESWAPPPVIKVTHDLELKPVIFKKGPPINVKDNIGKDVEDTVTVRHSATISESWKSEGTVKANITAGWFSIGGEIKSEIQKATSTTYEVETARRRKVTVTDRSAEYVRVVWVNYFRVGTVTTKVDDKEVTVPFMFWEDFDLLLEEVKPGEKK